MPAVYEAVMKIVHVETGRHFYGGAQQVIWLIKGLAVRGIDNILICPPGSGIDIAARKAGIPVRNLECAGDLDFRFAWRLRQMVNGEKPDVVHCHSRRGSDFLGGQALALTRIPAVLSRRVDNAESGWIAKLRYWPFRKVIAISEHVARVLAEAGLDLVRLETIRSAVDVDSVNLEPDCEAFRKEFEIDDGDFVVAMVSQFIPRKGHRFLFDVIPNLRDTYPNIRVLLFGGGPGEEDLRALAMRLNLFGTLQFVGFREDIDDYFACIDLLVHPATNEGLGVAMLKAASARVPVLAFDTAGAREAVVHGKTGILVPPADVAMLQKAIAVMIDETEMRGEFGGAGRQRMEDEFAVETMVERHVELYESVIND